jgi:hypothetical protein
MNSTSRSEWEYQIAAGNAGWPVQFRFAVRVIWSRVPELALASERILRQPQQITLQVVHSYRTIPKVIPRAQFHTG